MPNPFFKPQGTNRRFAIAAGVSVLLHLLLIVALRPQLSSAVERRVEVELLTPTPRKLVPPKVEQRDQPVKAADPVLPPQFVPPSQPSEPPPETRFRAEHDSRAAKQTLKRGDELAKQAVKVEKPSEPPKQQAKAEHSKPESPSDPRPPLSKMRLKLSDSQLARAFGETAAQSESSGKQTKTESQPPDDRARERKFEQTAPFQSSLGASLFRGNYGSSDHLPEIPDGDITLLNAKADRYAVFVRRVGMQVFGALRKLNWHELSSGELRTLSEFVTVEAVMSKSGKLLRVEMRETSGSTRFDGIAKKAAEIGTWDQNPPPDAADADGNIHFIFKARSWSRPSPNGVREQRWLLLGTGLM